MLNWKLLKTKKLLHTHLFNVTENIYRMANGKIADQQYIIERHDSAIIAVFTKKMELVMVKQYRHTFDRVEYELPAGHAEKSDKSILHSAKREFLEETGYKAKTMKHLAAYSTSPGVLKHTMHFFIGFDAKPVSAQHLDHSEEIEVLLIPWKKALKMVDQKKSTASPASSEFCWQRNIWRNARKISKFP